MPTTTSIINDITTASALPSGLRHFDMHAVAWRSPAQELELTKDRPGARAAPTANVRRASLLADVPDRLGLDGVAFEPDFYIPTHYHDVDQFLLIVNGEFSMGNRTLRPGSGAFMPAGNAYNVTIGRAGGAFLEFREKPRYRTAFTGEDAYRITPNPSWEIPGWTKPEKKKGRTVFFDAETQAGIGCEGFGPGDLNTAAPAALVAAMRYQALHLLAEGYSMISVATDRAFDCPRHRQDADKVIYVLSGELCWRNEERALRAGAGLFVPAASPVAFSTGPAGAKYLEFRREARWRTEWLGAA